MTIKSASPKKSLKAVELYSTSLFEPEYKLKLDANENLMGPSPKVMEKLKKLRASDVYSYPVYGELYQRLAVFNKVEVENLLVTNGADEAIYAILQAYLEPSDSILTASPTFVMPKIYSKILGAKVVEAPYKKRWEFDVEGFLEKIDDSIKVAHLTTPNNPTGDIISKSDLERILEASKGKIVLIDEVYANFSDVCYLDLLQKYDNAVIIRSFSKDFALAGLRLGYMISQKSIIEEIKKVLSPYNVNNIAVIAGCTAIDDFKHFKKQKIEFDKSKQALQKVLEQAGGIVFESFANFLCVDFGEKAEFIYKRLLDAGIKVRYFANSAELEGVLRITIPPFKFVKDIEMALKIKPTVVFDMDGVLIDTANSYRLAIQKTYEFFAGQNLDTSEIQKAKDRGGLNNDWDLTEFLLKKEGINIPKNDIIEKFQEFYWNDGRGLINDEKLVLSKNILNKLAKKYNLAIFTGRPMAEALYTLELNSIKDLFYPIITMDDLPLTRQKPDTLGIEVIRKKTISESIYYLGDTVDDMSCAKNATVKAIGVVPPHIKLQNDKNGLISGLIKSGAMIVLEDVNRIQKALERLK